MAENQIGIDGRIIRPFPDAMLPIDKLVCGCGCPEIFWQLVLDVLEAFEWSNFDERQAQLEKLFGKDVYADRWKAFAMYVLASDSLNLMEHGSTLTGSWLTPAGRTALSFLRQYGSEWNTDTRWQFVDSAGCVHSML